MPTHIGEGDLYLVYWFRMLIFSRNILPDTARKNVFFFQLFLSSLRPVKLPHKITHHNLQVLLSERSLNIRKSSGLTLELEISSLTLSLSVHRMVIWRSGWFQDRSRKGTGWNIVWYQKVRRCSRSDVTFQVRSKVHRNILNQLYFN